MKLHCPFCTKEITPETTQCPSCNTIYGSETLGFLRSLVKEALQEYPDEHRKQFRVPKTFKAAYSTSDAFINSYLSDISTGGLYIRTNDPLSAGESINLKIFLPDKKKELKVFGKVIWCIREDLVTPERKIPPGMGIKFLNLSKKDKERIISVLSQSST